MVNVDCAGGQDRATTTSETHPYIPPSKTRNCYTIRGNADFDSSLCGTSGDRACVSKGGINACKPDNYGGYCKYRNRYYVASGDKFLQLTQGQLLDRYKEIGDTDETGREVRRALNDQERRFTNRIRELQIMGKNPLIQKNEGDKKEGDKEVHSFVSDMLTKIGIGFSVIMFIISICVILIQNKII
tara:strand:- start:17 stop:574 length:558 start_codon:yes stop_codon:yes gene_type:complete